MIDPSPITGDGHEEALYRRVCKALEYCPKRIAEDDPDPTWDWCPAFQVRDMMRLVKAEQVRMYRKGWQRIVDAETPPVPDLIFNEQREIANLTDADVTPDFSAKGPKPHKLECTGSDSCFC